MTTPKPATKATPKPATRLTPKQWAEAEALWESGEVTLDDLAAKFSKHKSNFSRHFDKNGIKRGAKAEEHKKKIAEAVTAAGIDEASVTAARIKETKEEHYKMSMGLAKLVWQEVLTAKTAGNPLATATANLKALDIAATALAKLRNERWEILGLNREDYVDGDVLPELVISELTADEIQKLQDRDVEDLGLAVGEAVQLPEGLDVVDDDDENDENEIIEEGVY